VIVWCVITCTGIELLDYLPKFLDGLFELLEDETPEIVEQTELVLAEFLREITASIHTDLHPMVNILVHQVKIPKHKVKRRLCGLIWIHEFLKLAKFKLIPFYPSVLLALLQCIHDTNSNIAKQADTTNKELHALVKAMKTLQEQSGVSGVSASECICVSVSADEEKGERSEETKKIYQVLEILREALESDYVQTKLAALHWIRMMLVHLNLDMKQLEASIGLFPVLLKLLCDPDSRVLSLNLTVLSQISIKPVYFHSILVNLLLVLKTERNLLAVRGKFIIEKLCELLGAKNIYVAVADKLLNDPKISCDIHFCSLMVQSSVQRVYCTCRNTVCVCRNT